MPIIQGTNFLKTIFEVSLRNAFASSTTPKDYKYTPDELDVNSRLRIYRAFNRRMFMPPCIVISVDPGSSRLRYVGDKEFVAVVYGVDSETVVSNTLQVLPVLQLDTVTDGTSIFTEGANFTFNKQTGVFTWITPNPPAYTATYRTLTHVPNYTFPMGKWVQSQVQAPVVMTIYGLSTVDRERVTDLVVLYVRHVFRDALIPYVTYIDIRVGGESEETWDNQILYKNTVTVDCWTQFGHFIDQSTFELIKNIDINQIILES